MWLRTLYDLAILSSIYIHNIILYTCTYVYIILYTCTYVYIILYTCTYVYMNHTCGQAVVVWLLYICVCHVRTTI